ncbi:hypothetical protein QL285_049641 [Trifolium repens]|nr:hypothetical protein QL285_049641 [Trifolium repens]
MSFCSKPLKLLTRLTFPKHHLSHTTFNNNNNGNYSNTIVTLISNSFRTKQNWDTITKKFTSIKLTPSLVQQILLGLCLDWWYAMEWNGM